MMRNNRALRAIRRPLMLAAVFALGLAPIAGVARAQGEPDKPAAAAEPTASPPATGAPDQKPNPVGGVTVQAPRPGGMIPDDEIAALAAQAARDKAWRDYRKSMPRLTPDLNDLSKDYPGLQSYVPEQ